MKDPKYRDVRWADAKHEALVVTIRADETMRKLAKEAVDVQDAVNLCGLAQRFAKVMLELVHHPQNVVGTTWANQHPVVHLWVDKFAHLAAYQQSICDDAYAACCKLADGKDAEWWLPVRLSDRYVWERLLREGVAEVKA